MKNPRGAADKQNGETSAGLREEGFSSMLSLGYRVKEMQYRTTGRV